MSSRSRTLLPAGAGYSRPGDRFPGFARSVMGPYASSERYRGLDAAGQAQLREQLDKFTG